MLNTLTAALPADVAARQALSIHVYAPRLRSMTFYENRPDRGLAAVRTEVSRPDLVLV